MADRVVAFELEGYRGVAVPCALHEAEGDVGAAVVLPGRVSAGGRLGGSPARPDLWYARALLRSLRPSVLEVWWNWDGAPAEARREWARLAAAAACARASEALPLRAAVGRSSGTAVLVSLVDDLDASVATAWIAPPLGQPGVEEAVRSRSADEAAEPPVLARLRETEVREVELEGADRSLSLSAPAASARALADALDAVQTFLTDVMAGAAAPR